MSPWTIGIVSLLLACGLAVRVLSAVEWDVTIFGAFGEDAVATRSYAEERLGELFLRRLQGHDGKFFFVQANDPWLLDPADNAQVLDRPLYRSQRMLYPVLAGGGGLFPPDVIIWAMLVVNLLALGAGSWAVAALATEMGGSPWWGLSFVLNIGFLSEMYIGGGGVVAAAFAFWGVVFLIRRRVAAAVPFLALSALSREAMLIAAAGSAWWLWRRQERRTAAAALAVPTGAVALWGLYLRLRLGFESGVSQIREIGFPFAGLSKAFRTWTAFPLDLVVGVVLIVLLLAYSWRVLGSNELVGWAFLGFVPLAVVFTEPVWTSYFDITRAVAPVITSFALLAFVRGRSPSISSPGEGPGRHETL